MDETAAAEARARLRAIISRESVLEGGAFTLASGATSSVFFDMKRTMLDPEGASLITELLWRLLRDEDVDYIGGLAMGAVPLIAQLCQRSWPERPIRAFFVRKEVKDHGTAKLIDGHIEAGTTAIIFEDVTTTGSSALQAIRAVRERGCRVSKVVTIVDREEGARANLAAEDLELVALFTRSEIVD